MAAPRSGTRTFAALLRHAELDIGHEQFGSDGCVSSYLAVRGQIEHGRHRLRGESRAAQFDQVWRLHRHPLDTIGSIASGMHASWWRWQAAHSGVPHDLEPVAERAALFWLSWQALMDSDADIAWSLRIEDARDEWRAICRRLGVDRPFPADISTRGHAPRSVRCDLSRLSTSTRRRVLVRMNLYGYQEAA